MLDEAAALGEYSIMVYLDGKENSIGGVNFGVADYRKADFLVDVAAQPKDLLPGENFTATIQAEYFAGGPLVYADVAWSLQAAPFVYSPPSEYSGYSFSDDDLDAGYYNYSAGYPDFREFIGEGKGKTDENGHAEVILSATLAETGKSRQLIFETIATDFAGTAVAGRDSVIVHRSAVYPGIRPQTYVGLANQEQAFQV